MDPVFSTAVSKGTRSSRLAKNPSRCLLLLFLAVALASSSVVSSSSSESTKSKKPDVLIVVSDDQGYSDVSWTGGVFPTSELEALKNESVVLSNFYVHPVCTPSRAALLTGKFAARSGMTGPLLLGAPCNLDDSEPTFAQEMKARGYYTALSGKWHLGHHSWSHTPVGHGFDEFHGVLNCCAAYYSKVYYTPFCGHKIDWRNGTSAVAPAPSAHASELFADRLVSIISSAAPSTPLFLLLTFTAPHSPLQSEPRHLELCAHVNTVRRRTFCGLMMSVDEAVGRVRRAMIDAGRWDDSIVFFTNDNGGNVWEGGRNYPFRGGKQSSWEGGARATGLLKLPKHLDNVPKEFDGLAHISDVMPSVLGYIDRLDTNSPLTSAFRDGRGGDWEKGLGYDLTLPILGISNDNMREDVLMSFEPATDRLGYRWGNWKLIAGVSNDGRRTLEPKSNWEWIGNNMHDFAAESIMHILHWVDEDASGSLDETVREISMLIQENFRWAWSFVTTGGRQASEVLLFDLSVDPYEDNNLASKKPEIVGEMLERVERMKSHFPPNCDWMLMDRKIEYESVTYLDETTGRNVTKMYHSPWVEDADYETYKPHLFALNDLRKFGCSALAFLEALCIVFVVFKFCKTSIAVILGSANKKKQD